MLTVSDPIQIPSKTTHKDKGTKVNTFYYFISKYSVRDHCGTYRDPLTLEGLKGGEATIFFSKENLWKTIFPSIVNLQGHLSKAVY